MQVINRIILKITLFFLSNSDIQVDLKKNNIKILNKQKEDWKIDIVDTGKNTMTGGRLKRVQKYIGEEDFSLHTVMVYQT